MVQLRVLYRYKATDIKPPWNTSPLTPSSEVEDSLIQSVCQQLQEELERCSTQDKVGETIYVVHDCFPCS